MQMVASFTAVSTDVLFVVVHCGKTFTSAIVDFPPNARAASHRHDETFVYA
jgi:hypothetical protein